MDNIGSLWYSGRLFHTIGPDAVKERRPYVDSLTGGTTSLVALRGSETVTRWPSWRRNEQFRHIPEQYHEDSDKPWAGKLTALPQTL